MSKQAVVTGLETAHRRASLETVGIDTWGVDTGLLPDGHLLAEPYPYRDPQLRSTREQVLEQVFRREISTDGGVFAASGYLGRSSVTETGARDP